MRATSTIDLGASGCPPITLPDAGPIWVGISGWLYPPWRGVFYPARLRQAAELGYASRQFSSIEVNGSFYSLQRPETYQLWYDQSPPDFLFALKGGRFVTHMKRLKDARAGLANFFASGVLRLREKLGPILWQLPPNLEFDAARLRQFFELLPKTTSQAAALAQDHGPRLYGRSEIRALRDMRVRHALEVRHPSFVTPAYTRLLREFEIASCVADSAGLYPVIEDMTSDFVYVRLHGAQRLYVSGYGPRALRGWSTRIASWAQGRCPPGARLIEPAQPEKPSPREVFVYFDNDVKVRAPFDAANLQRLLKNEPLKRSPRVIQRARAEQPRTSWPAWQKRTG